MGCKESNQTKKTKDYPKFIVSNQKEESISIQRVNECRSQIPCTKVTINAVLGSHVQIHVHSISCESLVQKQVRMTRQFHNQRPTPTGTALANSMESDLGCTLRIYFDNVTLMLHNVTLTSQKPCQHKNKCDCSKTNGYKCLKFIFFSIKYRCI